MAQSIDFEIIWKKLNVSLTEQEEKEFYAWLESSEEHRACFLRVVDHHYKKRGLLHASGSDIWKKSARQLDKKKWKKAPLLAGNFGDDHLEKTNALKI